MIFVRPKPKSFYIRTFGCQMNEHDSERIAGMLEADGMRAVDSEEAADLVVLNTCCIRENADNRLYGTLGHLKASKDANPNLQIAVGGCLAQKDQGSIQKRAPWVDAVFGTHNISSLGKLLKRSIDEGPVMEILKEVKEFPSALPMLEESSISSWLAIQIGCDNKCAFCIVPSVRGKEISRPFDDIVAEAVSLVEKGAREITLLGQNVNSYGRDLSLEALREYKKENNDLINSNAKPKVRPMFADLLRSIGSIDNLERVRFTSPHPKDMQPEVYEAMAETNSVCEHLHFPLQSGSDRILSRMHRGYSAEKYLAKLQQARETIDDVAITTDIIVGFPGETEADFINTCEVAAEAQYDSAFVFKFSPRPGTEAAEMVDEFVPESVVANRFERLDQIVEHSALHKHQERIGRIENVLIEGVSKSSDQRSSGRTRQGKLIHFDGRFTPGTIASVEVTSAAPHFLRGELKEVISVPPKQKKRIPLSVV